VGNFVLSYVLLIENFVGPLIPLNALKPSIGTFDVPKTESRKNIKMKNKDRTCNKLNKPSFF